MTRDHADAGTHDARRLARGCSTARDVRLDPAAMPAVEASARAVDAIVARGEPVYGINTGFGKLAERAHRAPTISPRSSATSCCRMPPASASRCAGRDRAPDDGAQAREPRPRRLRRAAGNARHARSHAGARRDPGRSVPGLGRRLRRSRAARAPDGGHARRRRSRSSPANACRRRPRSRAPGSRRSRSARRRGSRCSTARSSRPADALAGLFAIERVFRAALVTGALSTDAAKGSDTPFDARIHALRGHRGQIDVAAALRALMAGSAIRASHLLNDDRVQDPYCLRCQPQVMGAVLDLVRQAAATLATEANGVSDNPLIFAETRRGAVRREFPRRAGRVRGRHAGHRGVRDRLARRAAHRHAGRSRAVGLAGVPHAAARAELRLHDRAGDGRGAGRREQAARRPGERRFDPDLGQPGGPRVDGGARRAPARRPWRRTPSTSSPSNCWRRRRAAISTRRCASSLPLERVRARLRERVPGLDDDRYLAPDIAAAAELVRSGALVAAAGIGHASRPRRNRA